ncbi:MAG: hypothetical protein AAF962_08895 [Actinomycetota bacterium]
MRPEQADLLIAEYQNGYELANHVDGVRNVLTSFYLTVIGGLVLLAGRLLDPTASVTGPVSNEVVLSAIGGLVLVVGLLMTVVVARLRRVQLERYVIANRILDVMLLTEETSEIQLRSTVHFSNKRLTFGQSARYGELLSGSFCWTLLIVIPNSLVGGAIAVLIGYHLGAHALGNAVWSVGVSSACLLLHVQAYLGLARFDG